MVTFLEHIKTTRGQAMPNSNDTYLYIKHKKVLAGCSPPTDY